MVKIEIKSGSEELKTSKLWRAVFAEFLGTIFLLLCVTTVGLFNAGGSASNVEVRYCSLFFGSKWH